MAVPKRKTTPTRRGWRRSHHSLLRTNSVECPNCGEFKLPHHICGSCGYYNQKEIINKTSPEEDDKELDSQS